MTTTSPQRDPDTGRFTTLEGLFDRERSDHERDHDRERQVARETALRLEREVEETAKRIERIVQTALAAVGDTARVHAEAHAKEHQAHERIHAVEKIQVDKAESAMNERLERMNEFRAALTDQSARMLTREVFETYVKEREARLQGVIDRVINLEKSQVSEERVDTLRDEAKRQRVGFVLAVGLLGIGVFVNLVANLAGS